MRAFHYQALNEALANSALLDDDQNRLPKAYLNYLLYDTAYQLIDQGFVQISEAAKVNIGEVSAKQASDSTFEANHEKLSVDLEIEQNGYLYTYVSNESNWDVPVYFDNFEAAVASTGLMVVDRQDYYAFGLSHQQPLDDPPNKYLYNGKELNNSFGLGLYDYGARMYDPSIGRWSTIDPRVSDYYNLSPYNYVADNPIIFRDPDGEGFIDFLSGTANSVASNHRPTQAGRGLGAPSAGSVARGDYNSG